MISSPMEGRPTNPNARYIAMAEQYKSHLCTGLGAAQLICGLLTAISIFPTCIIAGVLQILCAIIVLAIESPTLISPFLPQLQPLTALAENRPPWQKIALYGGLFLLPFFLTCIGLFFLLGQICALGVAVVYGLIYMGQKQSLGGDMGGMSQGYQQGGEEFQQPYSPTSP